MSDQEIEEYKLLNCDLLFCKTCRDYTDHTEGICQSCRPKPINIDLALKTALKELKSEGISFNSGISCDCELL